MKKHILILILFSSLSAFAQTLKSYSGPYENGTAKYQYYENDNYERILNGPFTYNEGQTYSITGEFKNNLRVGVWKATITEKNFYTKQLTSKVATATYVAGNLEGLCNYTYTEIATKRILAKSTANFRNNTLIGSYTYDVNDQENDFSISISLNQDGFADSTSIIKYRYRGKLFEDILKFRNGFLYWELHRDMTNGNILKRIERKKLIDEICANYDSTSNIAIVSYVEFARSEEVLYFSLLGNNTEHSSSLGKQKNDDTIYYQNAPFTFLPKGINNDYDSYWDLYVAIDFWKNGDCEYCGNRSNPLYYHFPKGANTVSYKPIKELVFRDDLYSK